MAAMLVQVCVDHRLNHELLRAQARQKLERLGLAADRIYILNEIGGNLGMNFRNTVNVLIKQGEPIALCAVLHHDNCLAADQGLRTPLPTSAQQMTTYLTEQNIRCRVLTGTIRTEHNHLLWSDEPEPRYQPFSFGLY